MNEDFVTSEVQELFRCRPPKNIRNVDHALKHADDLESFVPEKVLPYPEDWDIIILAEEVRRLRKMIDL